MKIKKLYLQLTVFERLLWLASVLVIILSFLISGCGDVLTVVGSLIGVTALIFMAKGYILGQVLTIFFAVFYGIVSFFFSYYGELITYLFLTAPSAVAALISWMKNPYEETNEVRVSKLSRMQWVLLAPAAALVTTAFFFILSFLGNANIIFSTLSVTTSFMASYLTFFRSPYYAIAYAANDIVLIVLWLMATMESISYLPMVLCFVMFLINDIYAFYNWRKMERRQSVASAATL